MGSKEALMHYAYDMEYQLKRAQAHIAQAQTNLGLMHGEIARLDKEDRG